MNGVIDEFQKNSLEKVRVAITEYHGKQLIDLRIFYLDNQGNWAPTRKGISLGVEKRRVLPRPPASHPGAWEGPY